MLSKILRADNTELLNIKAAAFHEAVNATVDLRPGCVSSAYIDVVVYGAQSSAPTSGEPLRYYQVDAQGNETYIGTFYAEPSIPSRNTYSFVAFDAVDKLNVDFSARLLAIQANFPMTLAALVTEACGVAGVTLATTNFPMASTQIQSFYIENITCRDVLSYAAEIACRFIRCNSQEQIIFDWYALDNANAIAPASGSGLVAYKQNGLQYQNYSVANIGCVAIRPLGTENAAYIYPTTFEAAYATDPLNNGVVTLHNLIAVDDGTGGITLSGNIDDTDDGNGNVTMESEGGGSASNALVITNNILLTNATEATMTSVAQHIYTEMLTIPVFRPARVELFPMENLFRAGDVVRVTDIQGVSFYMPLMSQDFSQQAAVFEATGNESYDYEYEANTSKALRNLANSIVQIDRLKVGYAEIDEAVIDSLEANGINANWINAGQMSVGRIDFNSYAPGINIPDVNDPDSLLSGQTIVDGWIETSTGLMINGDASSFPGNLFITFESAGRVSAFTALHDMSAESWYSPSYGFVDSDGVLTGPAYQYEADGTIHYVQTVNTRCGGASSFSFRVTSGTKFRNVRVFSDTSADFTFGFGSNVSISTDGIQSGLFVVDKTGNVTANGPVVMTNSLTLNGVNVGNALPTFAQTTYTINGLAFRFRRYGRIVVATCYGSTPTAAIDTNAWASDTVTVADEYIPATDFRSGIVAAIASGTMYGMQVMIGSSSGVFQVGYAAPQIPTTRTVRCEFVYIAKA